MPIELEWEKRMEYRLDEIEERLRLLEIKVDELGKATKKALEQIQGLFRDLATALTGEEIKQ